MRQLLRVFIAIAYLASATLAQAGFVINSYAVAASCTPGVLTYIGATALDTNSDPANMGTVAIGTASADRLVVVATTVGDSSSTTFSGLTIGGVSATKVADSSVTLGGAAIFALNVTTGTTANITNDMANSPLNTVVNVYTITGLNSMTATDSDTSSASDPSVSVTVPDCGIVIAAAVSNANTSTTWVGVTENNDQARETSHTHTSASTTLLTGNAGLTVQADFGTNTSPNLAVAVFR